MAYIKEYWKNKEKRAEEAKKHTKEMAEQYGNLSAMSENDTKIYEGIQAYTGENKPEIIVEDLDSVSAVLKYANGEKTAVLNFASFKNPGGMFLNGSKAQEECLCHESYLYNVLSQFEDTYYVPNRKKLNRALYHDKSLYTPHILFKRGNEEKVCDVITCAAPNKSSAQKYCNVTDEENRQELKWRIEHLLSVADSEKVGVLILGAFGCGVFGQNPTEVAELFKQELEKPHSFSKVVFAIPGGNENLKAFQKVYGD